MSTEVLKALTRIEADTAMIRRLVGAEAPHVMPNAKSALWDDMTDEERAAVLEVHTKKKHSPPRPPKKGNKAVVPEIAASYTPDEAKVAHQQIENAYQAQLIDYDKKRGLKMRVTKATVGWTPDKKKAA